MVRDILRYHYWVCFPFAKVSEAILSIVTWVANCSGLLSEFAVLAHDLEGLLVNGGAKLLLCHSGSKFH